MNTRITELLDIRLPIMQLGLVGGVVAEHAAAVCDAGALGMLTAPDHMTPQALAEEVERCRRLTSSPFGISLVCAGSPPAALDFDLVIDRAIKVVETGGTIPPTSVDKLKRHGVRILHRCTSLSAALSAERSGVDAIALAAAPQAGFGGDDPHDGLALIAAATRALRIPVIACMTHADGRGMAAALALGADGVGMELRFRGAGTEGAAAAPGLPSCDELLQCIGDECRAALARASRLAHPHSRAAAAT